MPENAMAARGRPAKILTSNDLLALQQFLEKLPFLKKNQQQALTLLQQSTGIFNDKQCSLLKTIDRDKHQFLKRQALIEQITLKEKNQQSLLANEIEILALLHQEMDRDHFFRLDRALESYQKIEKAALENRIRLENEQRREVLNKSHKQLTEAQKKRNAENQLKYALGGMIQSLYKDQNINITLANLPELEQALLKTLIWEKTTKNTKIYQDVQQLTHNEDEAAGLFLRILEQVPKYKIQEQAFHIALINKQHKLP